MDHSFYTDRLSAYFDQELKHEEHVIVDEHVKGCDECQKILARLEKFDSFIDDNSELADTEYWEKSAQKIEEALTSGSDAKVVDIKKESSYKGLWWKVAGVAASIALIAFISLYETDITDQLNIKEPVQADDKVETITDEESKDETVREENESVTSEQVMKNEAPAVDLATPKTQTVPGKTAKETDSDSPVLKSNVTKEKTSEEAGRSASELTDGATPDLSESFVESKNVQEIQSAPSEPSPQSSKLVEKSAAADEAIEAYEKVREEEAPSLAKKITLDHDSNENEEELVLWQNTIITQNNILSKYDRKKSSKRLTNGFAARSDDKDSVDRRAVYKELFEAYYNVALLSRDSVERKDALLQLNNYANDSKFMYQNTAKQYLNQFDSIQTLNLQNVRNKRK